MDGIADVLTISVLSILLKVGKRVEGVGKGEGGEKCMNEN